MVALPVCPVVFPNHVHKMTVISGGCGRNQRLLESISLRTGDDTKAIARRDDAAA